jgi:hypothetical protein
MDECLQVDIRYWIWTARYLSVGYGCCHAFVTRLTERLLLFDFILDPRDTIGFGLHAIFQ